MNKEVNFETEELYQKANEFINSYFVNNDGTSATFTDTRDHYENGNKTLIVNCWHGPKKITIRGENKDELNFLEKKIKEFDN
jgi:hypothetical protein